MNNSRRKVIKDIIADIETSVIPHMQEAHERLTHCYKTLEDIKGEIETCKEEEEEYLENMPEGLKSGEKGEAAEAAVAALDKALEEVEEVLNSIDEATTLVEDLGNINGSLDEAAG